MDFNTALRRAGMGEYVDGHGSLIHRKSQQTQQYQPTRAKATNLLKAKATPVQTAPAAIWPEYAQKPALHPYHYSEAAHKARVAEMDALFKRATAILDGAYKAEGY